MTDLNSQLEDIFAPKKKEAAPTAPVSKAPLPPPGKPTSGVEVKPLDLQIDSIFGAGMKKPEEVITPSAKVSAEEAFAPSEAQKIFGVDPRVNEFFYRIQEKAKKDLGEDVEAGALQRGLQAGYYNLTSIGQGLKAIGAKAVGNEEAVSDAIEASLLAEAKTGALQPRYTKVEDLVKKGTLGDFLSYSAFSLGEQVPNIASMVATGGLGGFVGKQVAKLTAAKMVDEVAARALVRKFTERGIKAGAFAGSSTLETGATAEEQLTSIGDVKPLVAITSGLIKGALEVQTPLAFAQRFGIGEKLGAKFYSGLLDSMTKGGVIKRIAGGGFVAAGGEFVTEGLQETVDNFARGFVDENYESLGPEAASRILNAAFTGGIVGGGFGGVASALAGRPRTPGPAASEEEIRDILGPKMGFQKPGGFYLGEPGLEDPIARQAGGMLPHFHDPATAELGRRKGGEKIWQVDLSQIAEGDQTATLESLPDTPDEAVSSMDAASSTDGEMASQLRSIVERRNEAERKMREEAPGIPDAAKFQREADNKLAGLRSEYLALVSLGLRVKPGPKGGIIYVGENPISPTAIREVPSTGYSVDPKDVITVSANQGRAPFGRTQTQTPVRNFRGQIGEASGTAWVSRSDLEPWQVAMRAEDLPIMQGAKLPSNEIQFAPWVKEEDKAELIDKLHKVLELPHGRGIAYDQLLAKGISLAPSPSAKAIQLVQVNPRRLRHIPGHLKGSGALKLEALQGKKALLYSLFQGVEGYDQAKHAPGTVVVIGLKDLTGEERLNAQRAINALEAIIHLLGKDIRMVLDFSNKLKHSSDAYMFPASDNYGLIALNKGVLGNKNTAASALFHEFGHHLSFSLFENADAKVRSAIFTAWLHHLYSHERISATEFIASMHMAGNVIDTRPSMQKAQGQSTPGFFEARDWYQNWYDFDEWMAEQGGKYFTTKGTLGYDKYTANFFKNLFDKILEGLKKIGISFGVSFEPVAAYRGWIDDLIKRQGEPLTKVSIQENLVGEDVVPSYSSPMSNLGVNQTLRQQNDKWAWYIRWGWNLLQLASANRHIQGLQQYVERVRQWHIEKMSWIGRADGRIREWRALGKEQGQRLNDFIWDVESMAYLPPGANARKPTLVELTAMAKSYGLNREALELYLKIEGDFLAVLDKIEQVWRQDAIRSIQDPIALAKAMNEISRDMLALRSRPYFPHSRFGDWTVIVKDANGQLQEFRQFENELAQQSAFRELRASALSGWTVQMSKLPEEVRMFRGLPPQLIKQLAQKMQALGKPLTSSQMDALDLVIFDLSPANSFSKRLKKRKGVAGWDMDAMRSYANYFLHAGNHLARIEHGWALGEAIKAVQQSATSMEDSRKRVQIRDYLDRHYQYIMNPPQELHAIRSLAFTWYLGFAPDSALINFSQIPMVAGPYLAARFGDGRAIAELMKSTRDRTSLYWKLNTNSMSPDEYEGIDLAMKHGFIDESQATELAAVSEGSNMSRFIPGTSVQRGAAIMGKWASFAFQSVEKINRRIVFLAAYRLGRDNATSQDPKTRQYINELTSSNQELYQGLMAGGWTAENAVGFLAGRDAVERTQYEYAQWARPEFMRGKKGALFTFFMFTQNSLWFARYSPGNLRYLATMFFAAGLMGMPGADDLAAILKFLISKWTGQHFDPEQYLRSLVTEITDRPDLIMHGFGRESFGLTMVGEMMGIPIPGFDFSSRLGMGRVVPGVQPAFALGKDWNDRLAETVEDVIGPAYAIPMSLVEGLSSFDKDNFKTFERLLPRAFKNVMRSLRYATEGKETDAGGAELYRFDPEDPLSRLELGGVALGFVPTGLRGKWDRTAALSEAVTFWQGRRAVLMDQYYMAKRAKDRETVAEVRQAIRRFNRDVPSPRMRITFDTLQQSWKSREENRRDRQAGRAQQEMYEPVAREVNRNYPEVPRGPGGAP